MSFLSNTWDYYKRPWELMESRLETKWDNKEVEMKSPWEKLAYEIKKVEETETERINLAIECVSDLAFIS